jgi:alkanesulfonate monooxygenase SsuD/methylene tetrahydromethanopterin reductase-like flavin-dependent oxidoreductase (luciferase family)
MSAEQYRALAVSGNQDGVAEQARAYLDAGLDGLLFNMPDPHDLETVALAGKTLAQVVGE